MISIGFSFMLLRLAIGRRLRQRGSLQRQDKSAEFKHWISLVLYLIAIPLAFHRPWWALAIIAFVMVIWIYPTTPAIKKHTSDHHSLLNSDTHT